MTEFTIALNENERNELIRIINQEIEDTRVEMHRTHSPAFRDDVKNEEELLGRLLAKLTRQPQSAASPGK